MNMSEDLNIWIHIAFAVTAVGLGAVNLASAKGTPRHVAIGWVWIALMAFVAIGSFWIRELNDGALSWIHLLSAWTLFSMGAALYHVRIRRNIIQHRNWMVGTMIGASIAGALTLIPGRFIPQALGF
ncbi:MAG: DUF2306 domain-containing protein [Gammaproteobacteria bacterium AqS3]|nr:DUF2306 domain-containing protein [Gammaproteobacteria bacterium AqS3]